MNFNNLDDVEAYVRENLKGWTTKRGKQTYIEDVTPAKDYEVLQLFRPGTHKIPYAEFWRGYYDFSPEHYTGLYGPTIFRGFSCQGSMEFAMRGVLEEHRCP